MVKGKDQLWAKVLLYDIDNMTNAKKKAIAKWLSEQAELLLRESHNLNKQYRARFWK